MPNTDNESRKWLYDTLKGAGYNVGADYNEFDSLMSANPDSRKWAYDTAVSEGYDVGKDYDEFESLINPQVQQVSEPAVQADSVRQDTVSQVAPVASAMGVQSVNYAGPSRSGKPFGQVQGRNAISEGTQKLMSGAMKFNIPSVPKSDLLVNPDTLIDKRNVDTIQSDTPSDSTAGMRQQKADIPVSGSAPLIISQDPAKTYTQRRYEAEQRRDPESAQTAEWKDKVDAEKSQRFFNENMKPVFYSIWQKYEDEAKQKNQETQAQMQSAGRGAPTTAGVGWGFMTGAKQTADWKRITDPQKVVDETMASFPQQKISDFITREILGDQVADDSLRQDAELDFDYIHNMVSQTPEVIGRKASDNRAEAEKYSKAFDEEYRKVAERMQEYMFEEYRKMGAPKNWLQYIISDVAFGNILAQVYDTMTSAMAGDSGVARRLRNEAIARSGAEQSGITKAVAGTAKIALDSALGGFKFGGIIGNELWKLGAAGALSAASGQASRQGVNALLRLGQQKLGYQIAQSVLTSGASFAGYGMLTESLAQAQDIQSAEYYGQNQDFDFKSLLATGGTEFLKGGALGAFGIGAKAFKEGYTGIRRAARGAAATAGEIGLFTGMGIAEKAIKGENIDLKGEFIDNAGVILGLKMSHFMSHPKQAIADIVGNQEEAAKLGRDVRSQDMYYLKKAGVVKSDNFDLSAIGELTRTEEWSTNTPDGEQKSVTFPVYDELMQRKDIPWETKDRVTMALFGVRLQPKETGIVQVVWNKENGAWTVERYTPDNVLVDVEVCNSEAEARSRADILSYEAASNSAGAAELLAVSPARALKSAVYETAVEFGMTPEEVNDVYLKVNAGSEDETERKIANNVNRRATQIGDDSGKRAIVGARAATEIETGMDLNEIFKKDHSTWSPEERHAMQVYAERVKEYVTMEENRRLQEQEALEYNQQSEMAGDEYSSQGAAPGEESGMLGNIGNMAESEEIPSEGSFRSEAQGSASMEGNPYQVGGRNVDMGPAPAERRETMRQAFQSGNREEGRKAYVEMKMAERTLSRMGFNVDDPAELASVANNENMSPAIRNAAQRYLDASEAWAGVADAADEQVQQFRSQASRRLTQFEHKDQPGTLVTAFYGGRQVAVISGDYQGGKNVIIDFMDGSEPKMVSIDDLGTGSIYASPTEDMVTRLSEMKRREIDAQAQRFGMNLYQPGESVVLDPAKPMDKAKVVSNDGEGNIVVEADGKQQVVSQEKLDAVQDEAEIANAEAQEEMQRKKEDEIRKADEKLNKQLKAAGIEPGNRVVLFDDQADTHWEYTVKGYDRESDSVIVDNNGMEESIPHGEFERMRTFQEAFDAEQERLAEEAKKAAESVQKEGESVQNNGENDNKLANNPILPEESSVSKVVASIPTGRSLTAEESNDLLEYSKETAITAPELELTPENWVAEFGEDGIVVTPLATVKMGEGQYFKLAQQGRNGKLGMIKPTLEDPDFVIEVDSQAKDGNSERESSFIYVRSFVGDDGNRMYHFTSVTVQQSGMEVSVSNQEKRANRIKSLLKDGKLAYRRGIEIEENQRSASDTQNGESVLLDDSQAVTNADNNSAPLGVNSPDGLSEGKGTQNQENNKISGKENASSLDVRAKNVNMTEGELSFAEQLIRKADPQASSEKIDRHIADYRARVERGSSSLSDDEVREYLFESETNMRRMEANGEISPEDAMLYVSEMIWQNHLGSRFEQMKKGERLDIEPGKSDVDSIQMLFNSLNSDEYNGALFSRVAEVARQLGVDINFVKQLTDKTGTLRASGIMGEYDPSSGTISYRTDVFSSEYLTNEQKAKHILHEMLHGVTSYAMNLSETESGKKLMGKEMLDAVHSIKEIFSQVQNDARFTGMYGRKTANEMIAEISNPKFREALQEKNLWTKFKNAIKQFFGIPTGGAQQTTALAELEHALDDMLENFSTAAFDLSAGRQMRINDQNNTNTWGKRVDPPSKPWDKSNYKPWQEERKKYDKVPAYREVLDNLDPQTPEEVAAWVLFRNPVLGKDEQEGGVTLKGFRSHTGYGAEEQSHLAPYIRTREKGGKSMEEIGELISETAKQFGVSMDDGANAGLKALTDMLHGISKDSPLSGYIERNRMDQVNGMWDEYRKKRDELFYESFPDGDIDDFYEQQYGMTADEFDMESMKTGDFNPDFMFIGRKGKENLDKVNEQYAEDNIKVARRMERKKYSPKEIKIATGFERGADGKWRYEIPNLKLKAIPDQAGSVRVGDIVGDSDLLAAYPGLADVQVLPIQRSVEELLSDKPSRTMGRYRPQSNTIELNYDNVGYFNVIRARKAVEEAEAALEKEKTRELTPVEKSNAEVFGFTEEEFKAGGVREAERRLEHARMVLTQREGEHEIAVDALNDTLNHEIQHYIQHQEGFSAGGSVETVRDRIRWDLTRKSSDAKWAKDSLDYHGRVVDALYKLETGLQLLDNPKRILKLSEKFTIGGIFSTREQIVERGQDLARKYINEALEFYRNQHNDQIHFPGFEEVKRALNEDYKDSRNNIRKYSAQETVNDFERFERALKESTDYELYNRLSGEVEARNTERRSGMNDYERRHTLASETEDVERRLQLSMGASPDDDGSFSIRTKEEPKETRDVYKLMRLGGDGKVYPLFIDRNGAGLEMGRWYDADAPDFSAMEKLEPGYAYKLDSNGNVVDSKPVGVGKSGNVTGLPSKAEIDATSQANDGTRWVAVITNKKGQKSYQNIGINGAEGVGTFAMRPGWHAGSLPSMMQIGAGEEQNLRADNFVWVKGKIAYGNGAPEEALENGGEITTHIPIDGGYEKGTSSFVTKGMSWYISGSFKPEKILSDSEAAEAIDNFNKNVKDKVYSEDELGSNGKPKKGGYRKGDAVPDVPFDYGRAGDRRFYSDTMKLEDRRTDDTLPVTRNNHNISDEEAEVRRFLKANKLNKTQFEAMKLVSGLNDAEMMEKIKQGQVQKPDFQEVGRSKNDEEKSNEEYIKENLELLGLSGIFASDNSRNHNENRTGNPRIQEIARSESEGKPGLLEKASSFLRAGVGAGEAKSENTGRNAQAEAERIKDSVESFARENDILFGKEDLSGFSVLSGRSENIVLYSGENVLKVNTLSHTNNNLHKFLDKIENFNEIFSYSKYSLAGFYKSDSGDIYPIISQPYIKGEPATHEQIREHMENMGFEFVGMNTFMNRDYFVADVIPGNAVVMDGDVYVIDAEVGKRPSRRTNVNDPDFQRVGRSHNDNEPGLFDEKEPTLFEHISEQREQVNVSPTEAQKKAGNYKMGHIKLDGYDVTLENPKGSTRSGKDASGKEWSVTMNNDYGYIRGTEGVDGDHIDVFLSDDPLNGNVFVVDQLNPDGSFDEHKVMYGFNSADEARKAYLANYSEGWTGLGAITEVTKDEFKKWVGSSRRKTKAFSEYKSVKAVGGQNEGFRPDSPEAANESRIEEIESQIGDIDARLEQIGDESIFETAERISLEHQRSRLESELSGLRDINSQSRRISGMPDYQRIGRNSDKNLVAVHNISASNLVKSLELGGLAMPSIAITKPGMGHDSFGEISLVFSKDSIDPSDRRNQIFDRDAWSPTFPEVAKKLSEKAVDGISSKMKDLVPYDQRAGRIELDETNMADFLRRSDWDPVAAYASNSVMKQAYLAEQGKKYNVPMRGKTYGRYDSSLLQQIIDVADETGIDLTDSKVYFEADNNPEYQAVLDRIKEIVLEDRVRKNADVIAANPEVEKVLRSKYNMSFSDYDNLAYSAFKMKRDMERNGGQIPQVVDENAAREELDKKVPTANRKYTEWVKSLFEGVVEKEGIRNERDIFTPSGNRRSFEQTHDPVTLHNVVASMMREAERGGSGFFNSNIFGAAANKLNSIEDVKRESGRLQRLSEEELKAQKDELENELAEIAEHVTTGKFGDIMDFRQSLIDAVAKSHDAKGIYKELHPYWKKFTKGDADQVEDIVKRIGQMAAEYFEAKPRRAVPMSEVKVAVVPKGTDKSLIDALKREGIKVVKYDKDVEGSRAAIVERESRKEDVLFQEVGRNASSYNPSGMPAPKPGETQQSYAQRLLDYYQQAEAFAPENLTERDQKMKEAKDSVIRLITDAMKDEHMSSMSKGELSRLLSNVRNARPGATLNRVLASAEETVTRVKFKAQQRQIEDTLKMKVQDVNSKNMSVAKNVNDSTRKVFAMLRGRISDMQISGYDEDVTYLRRDNRFRQEQINKLERSIENMGWTDDEIRDAREQIEEHKAAIGENKAEISRLNEEKEAVKEAKVNVEHIDVDEAIRQLEEKMDEAAHGNALWTQNDAEQLTAYTIRKRNADIYTKAVEIKKLREKIGVLEQKASELWEQYKNEPDATRKQRLRIAGRGIRQQIDGIQLMINDAMKAQTQTQGDVINLLNELVSGGKDSLLQRVESEAKRRAWLIKSSYADVKDKDIDIFDKNAGTEHWAKRFFSAPLGSFEYMAQVITRNKLGKDGFFYKHFVEGEDGVIAANNNYLKGFRASMATMDGKCQELFGKGFKDVTVDNDKVVDNSGVYVMQYNADGSLGDMYELPLSKGQATYLYMVWKMTDGRAHMENQGFNEESMEGIRQFIGKENMAWADWIQDEYLPDLRQKYNDRYLEMYNTSLAEVENYVPLRIRKESTRQESQLSDDSVKKKSIQERVRSLINRTHNLNPIDITQSAFDVILDHVNQMEEWQAFARVRKDLDGVLSDTRFRNQLNANSRGQFDKLMDAAAVAAHVHHPDPAKYMDQVLGKLSKGIVGANIGFRYTTALKQTLSAPAFFGYSNDPKFIAMLVKNIGVEYAKGTGAFAATALTAGVSGKRMFEAAGRGEAVKGLSKTIRWAMENIPDFRERVLRATAGNEKLDEEGFSKRLDSLLNYGMVANQLVDAVTCSIGIKTIYDYKHSQLMKAVDDEFKHRKEILDQKIEAVNNATLAGVSPEKTEKWRQERTREMTEEYERDYQKAVDGAHNKAIMDADIYYNGTQQSNHMAFMSPMQMSRTLMDRMLTTYQNASIGYARKFVTSVQDLKRSANWKQMVQNYADQYVSENPEMSYEDAERKAKAHLIARNKNAFMSAILYGAVLNWIWDMGGRGLLGLFRSDDDNDKLWSVAEAMSLPGRGLPGMNTLVSLAQGDNGNPLLLYDELSDIVKASQSSIEDGTISNELLWTMIQKSSRMTGLDMETWSNIYLGLEGMVRDGVNMSGKDALLEDMMFFLNTPRTNRVSVVKQLYKDEPKELFVEHVLRASKYLTNPWESWMPNAKAVTQKKVNDIVKEFDLLNMTPEERRRLSEKEDLKKHLKKVEDLQELMREFDGTDDVEIKREAAKRIRKVLSEKPESQLSIDEMINKASGDESDSEIKAQDLYMSAINSDDLYDDEAVAEGMKALKEISDGLKAYEDARDNEKARSFAKEHSSELQAYDKLKGLQSTINAEKKQLGSGNDEKVMNSIRSNRRHMLNIMNKIQALHD